MELCCGRPFRGGELETVKQFLRNQGLGYDDRIEFSVCVFDGSRIAATGSLDGNVLKCVAVSPEYRAEGLAARIVTELINAAVQKGQRHLFIFTKPENAETFANLGFYPISRTETVLLMENRKDGASRFVAGLRKPEGSSIGAIVANCNPFTKGHQYLIETAAAQCSAVHLFILSEDKSEFPPEVRQELVIQGTEHLSNVIVQPTGPYLISAATFPEYFLKESESETVNAELDITIFAEVFARPLGITRRFVGTEPYSITTAAYNRQLCELLPRYGIAVTEVPRLEYADAPISASRVRALLRERRLDEIKPLTPPSAYEFLAEYARK